MNAGRLPTISKASSLEARTLRQGEAFHYQASTTVFEGKKTTPPCETRDLPPPAKRKQNSFEVGRKTNGLRCFHKALTPQRGGYLGVRSGSTASGGIVYS